MADVYTHVQECERNNYAGTLRFEILLRLLLSYSKTKCISGSIHIIGRPCLQVHYTVTYVRLVTEVNSYILHGKFFAVFLKLVKYSITNLGLVRSKFICLSYIASIAEKKKKKKKKKPGRKEAPSREILYFQGKNKEIWWENCYAGGKFCPACREINIVSWPDC